jgi:hypothetical protein
VRVTGPGSGGDAVIASKCYRARLSETGWRCQLWYLSVRAVLEGDAHQRDWGTHTCRLNSTGWQRERVRGVPDWPIVLLISPKAASNGQSLAKPCDLGKSVQLEIGRLLDMSSKRLPLTLGLIRLSPDQPTPSPRKWAGRGKSEARLSCPLPVVCTSTGRGQRLIWRMPKQPEGEGRQRVVRPMHRSTNARQSLQPYHRHR